jgi:hypothetical protein
LTAGRKVSSKSARRSSSDAQRVRGGACGDGLQLGDVPLSDWVAHVRAGTPDLEVPKDLGARGHCDREGSGRHACKAAKHCRKAEVSWNEWVHYRSESQIRPCARRLAGKRTGGAPAASIPCDHCCCKSGERQLHRYRRRCIRRSPVDPIHSFMGSSANWGGDRRCRSTFDANCS